MQEEIAFREIEESRDLHCYVEGASILFYLASLRINRILLPGIVGKTIWKVCNVKKCS